MSFVAWQHEGSSQPRDQTHVSCTGKQILCHWATREACQWMGFWRRRVGRNPLTPGMGAGVKAALSYQWLLCPISWRGSFWSVMRSSWKLHKAPTDSQVWPQVVKSILERAGLLRLRPLCSGSHLAMLQASPIRVKKEDLGLLPEDLLQVGRPPQSFLRDLPCFRYPVHDLPLRGPGCCTHEGGTSHFFIELASPGMVSGLWSHETFTHKMRSFHPLPFAVFCNLWCSSSTPESPLPDKSQRPAMILAHSRPIAKNAPPERIFKAQTLAGYSFSAVIYFNFC